LLVTVLDPARAGTAGALSDRRLAAAATALSARRGYLDGRALAEVFAWLRPDDLIWNYWVNNYLLGRKPPAFDILFWNADTTRMSAKLHADFVDLGLESPPPPDERQAPRGLRRPGAGEPPGHPRRHERARHPGRPLPDRGRLLCRRRDRRPHHALAELLPHHPATRWRQPLHPLHQRSHRRPGQPAGQPQGQLPDQQGQPGRRPAVAADRRDPGGQLVARSACVA